MFNKPRPVIMNPIWKFQAL